MSDTELRGDEEEGLTEALNRVTIEAGGTPSKVRGMRLHERSRAAWQFVRPYWNKTAWWTMLSIAVIMVCLDLNARFGGFLGKTIEWVRLNVMAAYPSVSFIAGMIACYYLVLHSRVGRGSMRDGE